MNRRRQLLLALGGGMIGASLRAVAQQPASMPLVAILGIGDPQRGPALRESLQKLGYTEGRNIRVEERAAGARYARLGEFANELVYLKPAVIVALSSTATEAARQATSTIPIVMIAGLDPVKAKFAASLSRPGGNVTGVTTAIQEITPKQFELARESFPGLSRIGIIWTPTSRLSTTQFSEVQEAAKSFKLELLPIAVNSPSDFDGAFAKLAKSRVNVFILLGGNMFIQNQKQFLDLAAKHRMAGIFSSAGFAEAGGLIGYGVASLSTEPARVAAVYVDKILKGAKPAELPIEQLSKVELTINLKTARALGIQLPQSILVRADRVIE